MKVGLLICLFHLLGWQMASCYADNMQEAPRDFPVMIFVSMGGGNPDYSVVGETFETVADIVKKVNEIRSSDDYQAKVHIVITEDCALALLFSLVKELKSKGVTPSEFFLSQEKSFSKSAFDAGRWVPFSFSIQEPN